MDIVEKSSTSPSSEKVEQVQGSTQEDQRDVMKRMESCGAPAGHVVGNFPRYYDFNPPAERMKALGEGIWDQLVSKLAVEKAQDTLSFLDIGCNDGTLTEAFRQAIEQALTKQMQPKEQAGQGSQKVQAFGVDIDDKLIERARIQYPLCTFHAGDIIAERGIEVKKYDLVTCFGTTMWVHLNHGDAGLKTLLEFIRDSADECVILEAQRWKSYGNAKRRLRVAQAFIPASFFSLKVQGDEQVRAFIDSILLAKFANKRVLGETNWGRYVVLYDGRRT